MSSVEAEVAKKVGEEFLKSLIDEHPVRAATVGILFSILCVICCSSTSTGTNENCNCLEQLTQKQRYMCGTVLFLIILSIIITTIVDDNKETESPSPSPDPISWSSPHSTPEPKFYTP